MWKSKQVQELESFQSFYQSIKYVINIQKYSLYNFREMYVFIKYLVFEEIFLW